jgi:DNA-binding transcriptional LysR family regulator
LKKLREDFKDPLFVRSAHGFQPTPRALELVPKAKEVLENTRSLYSPTTFDLKNYKKTVTLAMTTYFEALSIVKLMKLLEKEAPLVTLKTVSLQGEFPKKELESGEADLAIAAYFEVMPENYFLQSMGKDRHVVLMRKNHPYLKTQQTVKDYLDYSHVKVGIPINSVALVDKILSEKKQSRRIVGNFNNFLSPIIAISQTDSLFTIPEKLALTYKSLTPLEMTELPVKGCSIELKMVWHSRFQSDPFHQWLRKNLRDIYRD